MPDFETGRHDLPLLAVSQAQKEITYNEALVLIGALMHMAVETSKSNVPAAANANVGKCWIVSGSRFVVPHEEVRVWNCRR